MAGAVAGVLPAFADEDENEEEDLAVNRADDGRGGEESEGTGSSGGVERESESGEREGGEEFEDDDSEGAALGSGLSGLVLYGVIAAVVGTISYTAYKIFAGRKKASVPARP